MQLGASRHLWVVGVSPRVRLGSRAWRTSMRRVVRRQPPKWNPYDCSHGCAHAYVARARTTPAARAPRTAAIAKTPALESLAAQLDEEALPGLERVGEHVDACRTKPDDESPTRSRWLCPSGASRARSRTSDSERYCPPTSCAGSTPTSRPSSAGPSQWRCDTGPRRPSHQSCPSTSSRTGHREVVGAGTTACHQASTNAQTGEKRSNVAAIPRRRATSHPPSQATPAICHMFGCASLPETLRVDSLVRDTGSSGPGHLQTNR